MAKLWVVNAAKEEVCPALNIEEKKCRKALEALANHGADGKDLVEEIFDGKPEELEKFRRELKKWLSGG